MPPPNLTLILAATPSLGIGKAGGLPWPQLRKEMAYFARVTKRTSSPGNKKINAVVMGRKTWESIPSKFRPLPGRLNFVVTSVPEVFKAKVQEESVGGEKKIEGPVVVDSVPSALSTLSLLQGGSGSGRGDDNDHGDIEVDRVFVIGGATLYTAALALEQTTRILLTEIKQEFECDTFFSEDVRKGGWRKAERREMEEWIGEEVGGEVEEKGVGFEFGMWVRE